MELISPFDSIFLLSESREHPMHVASLQLFAPPDDAGPDFVREAYEGMLSCTDVQPTFRKHPGFFGGITNVVWSVDDEIELDYHLRRSALPGPGRVRDLLELVSRLHGSLLDRHRPLWEAHLVEGLADGRYALYLKLHHALVDGVSVQRLIQRTMTPDPDDDELRVAWALTPPRQKSSGRAANPVRALTGAAGSAAALAPATLSLARAALLEQQLTLPFRAPKTMFNVRLGGARRVAAQSWSLARFKRVQAAAGGATVNDVVLAMCAGALRSYLLDHHALPETPLVASVPVSLRTEQDSDGGGNMVGSILCNLATHLDDPAKRLEAIHASMTQNKKVFTQLPRIEQFALSAALNGGMALALLPGFIGAAPPPYNIVISNVPGPREPLYWKGARLDGNYPLSFVVDWQALNITLTNNADNLDFGLVGCRRSVPHLQRLLGHLEDSLKDLERLAGV